MNVVRNFVEIREVLSSLQILQLFSPFAAISVSCVSKKFRHMFLIGVFYLIVAGKIHILHATKGCGDEAFIKIARGRLYACPVDISGTIDGFCPPHG